MIKSGASCLSFQLVKNLQGKETKSVTLFLIYNRLNGKPNANMKGGGEGEES